MPIPEDVLAILACPACKQPVHPVAGDSALQCEACKRVYPVRDGIPVMLVEEAIFAAE